MRNQCVETDKAYYQDREMDELVTVEHGKPADLMLVAADPIRDVHAFPQIRLLLEGGGGRAPAMCSASGSRSAPRSQ
jgi:hypothetical protein